MHHVLSVLRAACPTAAALSAAILFAAPATAQTQVVHASFDTLLFADNSSMGGPNLLLGMLTQIPVTTIATRIEVWTGELTGSNSIALWTHDPVNNVPLAPLGTGSWAMGRTNGWQGASLVPPVALSAGQDVWVVWGPQNGAQASHQGSGAGGPLYRGSFDGGASWNGPFTGVQWKFRIWTGTPGHYEVFGTGCSGARGRPEMSWFGMPMTGASFNLQLDRAVPGTFVLLSFGDSNTQSGGVPLPYDLAPHGAPGCSVLGSLLVTVLHPTDPATGQTVVTVAFPADPGLVGFPFYNQWFCLDATANSLGLTTSNAGVGVIGG
jgi:hypothetical protein